MNEHRIAPEMDGHKIVFHLYSLQQAYPIFWGSNLGQKVSRNQFRASWVYFTMLRQLRRKLFQTRLFVLTPPTEKTKTQAKNSNQKLKNKTQPSGSNSSLLQKLKKMTSNLKTLFQKPSFSFRGRLFMPFLSTNIFKISRFGRKN